MFTIKAIGPDGQVQGFEATRFTINERRSTISILEPGNNIYVEVHVDRPDSANHVFIENVAGKTVESLHRGSVKDVSSSEAA